MEMNEVWPDERPELICLLCGQRHPVVRLLRLVLGHRGVDLGGEEGQQQVQVVDGQGVCHDVPALREKKLSLMLRSERRIYTPYKHPINHYGMTLIYAILIYAAESIF